MSSIFVKRQNYFILVSIVTAMLSVLCFSSFSLTVEQGLTNYQVLQANPEDKNFPIEVSGTCSGKGTIEMRVMGLVYEIIPWKEVGSADGSQWKATLADIPLGGPYCVELRLKTEAGEFAEKTSIYDVLVGDVWILAGQSNMQGVGNIENTAEPNPLVHLYSMGYKWRIAKDPLHLLSESPTLFIVVI
jgi:sialate O-acetylesterase